MSRVDSAIIEYRAIAEMRRARRKLWLKAYVIWSMFSIVTSTIIIWTHHS